MIGPTNAQLLYPTELERQAAIILLRSQIAGLQTALASGVTSASYDGKSVNYASFADLQKALSRAESQLIALLYPGYRRPTAGFAVFNRGNR